MNKSRTMHLGIDQDIATQVSVLRRQISLNPSIQTILERADRLGLPEWYLGAGCVTQTVWNIAHGFDPVANIKDYDIVYFDADDLSADSENHCEQSVQKLYADLDIKLDVTNEARVHIWYGQRFGQEIAPYQSVEHAINTWPTTATSVGVRYFKDEFQVYAPFGLQDLLSMVVRPNKIQITEEVYRAKVKRWLKHWPNLTVMDWDTGRPVG